MLLNCDVGEDSSEYMDCKEIKPVNPKGNQFWIFIGRTDAEAEVPMLWPPDKKSWLIRKNPDAGKDWRQEEKGTTEDEIVGWHHQPNGHEFEQAPGVGEGQWTLECCSPWHCEESDTTKGLNNKPFPSPWDLPDPRNWSHLGLLHCRLILYHLSHQGSPIQRKCYANGCKYFKWLLVLHQFKFCFWEFSEKNFLNISNGWLVETSDA